MIGRMAAQDVVIPKMNIGIWHILFIFYVFLSAIGLSPSALTNAPVNELVAANSGDTKVQIAYFLLVGILLISIVRNRYLSTRLLPPLVIVIALIWMCLSIMWSVDFTSSLRRFAFTFMVTCIGFAIVPILGGKRSIDILSKTLSAIIVIDVLSVIFLPGAIQSFSAADLNDSYVGAWRGLHTEKNMAGVVGAVEVLLCFYQILDRDKRLPTRILWFIFAALGILFTVKSESKTSLGLIPISGALGGLALAICYDGRTRALVGCLALGVAAAYWLTHPNWVIAVGDAATNVLNDPRAYTGRTQIWRILLDYAKSHLWLGAGYGGFWSVGNDGPFVRYAAGWLRTVPNAHNGYFDIVVQTGMIGLVLGGLGAILLPLASISSNRSIPLRLQWLLTTGIIFVALHNLTETSLFERSKPAWVTLVVFIAVGATFRGRLENRL